MQLQCNVCVANEEKRQAHNNEEMTSTNCDGVATVIDIDKRSRFSPLVEMRFDGEHSLSNFSHLIFVCFAACKHKFSAVPSTHGIFEAVVVSRGGAVEEPEDVPATQTYAAPSARVVLAKRRRRSRYRAELAHVEEDDLLDLGDGKEEVTHLTCGDLGDDNDEVGFANEQLWYARFSINGKLYEVERSSLNESFLEDIMDKCRNNIHTEYSVEGLKGAQTRPCGISTAMPCHVCYDNVMP